MHRIIFLLILISPITIYAQKSQPFVFAGDHDKFYHTTFMITYLLDSGKFDEAKHSIHLLDSLIPHKKEDWNYWNAIHKVNIAKGRLALRSGDVEAAKDFLIRAGKIEGSPQLKTFGPNLSLAYMLLEADEPEVVIKFLESCKSFWIGSEYRIDNWITAIKEGSKPDFGNNLKG